eukprot:TRINITY_DN1527_c0_g1_i1.p1 TRINITY_DN1527_c0_g1~~TRINITY_DN1527_c0_g1_i1.p1  ORF type:complete len:1315 (-),score=406.92 TRINITY_DN1527_c0_g1_i1:269-4150(-)
MALVAAAAAAAPGARGAAHAAKEPLGQIDRLLVENFKSYEGVQEIGPFDKFTCVIGPNGSGKSNIMDAISFCLGIRAKHLRGERLKDLVYRREEEDVDANTRSASVTLVFRTFRGELLHFRREIDTRGSGRYLAGTPDKMVSMGYDEYLEKLALQEVNVKARNFLVFQGDVMELARRQGTDLTGVLETISGSVQLKERYEKLAKELELSQEKTRMHFQHKRELECTVAMLEKQRAQVQRYHDLRKRRQALIIEAVLFRLLCAERDADRCREECNEVRAAKERSEADLKVCRTQLIDMEAKAKEAAVMAEEATSQHFVVSSNLEQLKPESGNCRKQATHYAGKLKEKEQQIAEEEARHKAWEVTMQAAQEERRKAEEEIERLRSLDLPSAVQLTEDQRAEFDDAVARTDATNLQTRERLREVEEEIRQSVRELQADRSDLKDLEEQRAFGDGRLATLASEKAALEAERASEEGQHREQLRLIDQVRQEVEKFVSFRNSLLEEQRALRFKLDAAQARRERLEQHEEKQRIADELRDAFPGVVGRISEVVLPTQKRFELALQMALGSMCEAFIVTDAKTGRDCVSYLKAKQISTETFLPLDRMVEPTVGPMHLLTRGTESRRLANVCVQPNEKFLENHPQWQTSGPSHIDAAVKFLLNGTVIVDDLEEAKKTAYKDARKQRLQPRVVTLEGEVIAPNGNMLVNSIGQSGRVEFGGAEQLREIRSQETKLVQLDQDLASLQDELVRTRNREAEVRSENAEVEEKRRSWELRFKHVVAAQASEKASLEGRSRRVAELKARVDKTEKRQAVTEKQRTALENELLKVGRQYFARLSRSLGVEDIREILQKESREKRKLRDQIDALEDHIRSLENREKGIQQKLAGASRLESLRRECEQYRRDIEATRGRMQAIEERSKVLSDRCEAARIRKRDAIIERDRLEQDARAKRPEVQRARALVEDTKKKLKVASDRVRNLLLVRCAIFRDSAERQIELPLLRQTQAALDQMRSVSLEEKSLDEIDAACRAVEADFASLSEERREAAERTSHGDTRSVDAEYEEQVMTIDKELEQLNPNMRAIEEHEAEEDKLREIQRQADVSSAESERLQREFEVVKVERTSKFMNCFKYVESVVHPTYKALTSYDGFQGGSAYLDLDDAEEPYNGGITFTACPPGKRFFPMELLSGGEKSMASMALLFAMHSYRPPPFMILDEVDAPFDRKNTNSLVSYLKTLKFQCLVISLKDSFFSHSDSIVGIFKDKQLQTSGSLVLPLKKFGMEEEDMDSYGALDAGGGAGVVMDVDID